MKKFDVIFTNPPYNNNIDLKLLNTLIENKITDKIIAIHPSSFIFSKRALKDKMKKWLKSVNIFWGNAMFKIQLFVPVCISVWSKEHNSKIIHVIDNGYSKEEYDSEFDNILYFGKKNKLVDDFKKRIERYMKDNKGSILEHNINSRYENMTPYSVKFSAIRGNVEINRDGVTENFWTVICKNREANKCNEKFRFSKDVNKGYGKCLTLWSFKNETEQKNFMLYCETKIVRLLLSFKKINGNLMGGRPTNIIPWMDFTKTWTDEKLIKEFGIDDELWNIIDKFIPDYYEDYRTKCRGEI